MKLKHKKPCAECPFLKTSAKGYFGPNSPEMYFESAHSEAGVECHQTLGKKESHACAGALIHTNLACKRYRSPELQAMQDAVGKSDKVLNYKEFWAHHGPRKSK